MIERTNDVELVEEAVSQCPDIKFDVELWLDEPGNIALQEDGSVGLFTFEYPGLYTGHYFFLPEVRGKEAKRLAIRMLREIYVNHYAKMVRGLVPLYRPHSAWMTRQLGFEYYGDVLTHVGPCGLYMMTPDQFFHHNKVE